MCPGLQAYQAPCHLVAIHVDNDAPRSLEVQQGNENCWPRSSRPAEYFCSVLAFGGALLVKNMTDSQTLLAEYAANGSEAAFRELVARYINFVYSTARRLVWEDAHLAEDVTQMVFINLAKKGRALSSGVMLGGWLHQHT